MTFLCLKKTHNKQTDNQPYPKNNTTLMFPICFLRATALVCGRLNALKTFDHSDAYIVYTALLPTCSMKLDV